MKTLPRPLGLACLGLALISPTFAQQDGQPVAEPDKFVQLTRALVEQKRTFLAEAREASELMEGYEEFLEDRDTSYDDRAEIRENLVRARARFRKAQGQALQIQAAIRELRGVPDRDLVSLPALKEAYQGLEELGDRGRTAWSQLLLDREVSLETLKENFAADLAEATLAYEDLDTTARAQRLLLDAIDSNRPDATEAEFHDSLKLPRLQSAVTLGFALKDPAGSPEIEAQVVLVALVGYSQFFWDHFTGARSHLSEGEFPRDHARNIFGVSDGGVVTSEAIARNQSSIYYLSEAAKDRFNRRIEAIWGPDAPIAVESWNQNYARTFFRACEAISTRTEEGTLVPSQNAFDLLDAIDTMIIERKAAARSIAAVEEEYEERIAAAKRFDEKSRLSSAQFNAQIWARESSRTMADFEAAHKLLDEQLAASAADDWSPNLKAISVSVQVLKKAHSRLHSVHRVKEELTALLQ